MGALIISVKLLLGLAALTFGADWLVRGSSKFALTVGVKPLVIGLTLIAFGTSAPEFTVSVAAALSGDAGISLGNVIGSNICNIALILGMCALIKPLPVAREMFARDIPMMLLASVLLVVLPFIGGPDPAGDSVVFLLSRPKALVLLVAFALWLWLLVRNAKSAPEKEQSAPVSGGKKLGFIALALLGLAVLIAGGHFFVQGAVELAKALGVPELVIGLTIVAVGTSLPEFATSLVASLRGQSEIAVGNIVGSNTFNILLILGVAALLAPLPVEPRVLQVDLPAMLLVAIALPMMAWRPRALTRPMGAVLLAFYTAYTLNLFFEWL